MGKGSTYSRGLFEKLKEIVEAKVLRKLENAAPIRDITPDNNWFFGALAF